MTYGVYSKPIEMKNYLVIRNSFQFLYNWKCYISLWKLEMNQENG